MTLRLDIQTEPPRLLSVQDHVLHVTDDFLEFISDGALAIEVWGHRCAGTGPSPWQLDALQAKSRTLRDRYGERTHTRRPAATPQPSEQ